MQTSVENLTWWYKFVTGIKQKCREGSRTNKIQMGWWVSLVRKHDEEEADIPWLSRGNTSLPPSVILTCHTTQGDAQRLRGSRLHPDSWGPYGWWTYNEEGKQSQYDLGYFLLAPCSYSRSTVFLSQRVLPSSYAKLPCPNSSCGETRGQWPLRLAS